MENRGIIVSLLVSINNESEMLALGRKIGELVKPHHLLFLFGNLGVGKTTLTKGIARGLKVTAEITSPTFQLLKNYQGKYTLNHLDLYRLETVKDLEVLEITELLAEGVVVVEWGELLLTAQIFDYLAININYGADPSVRELEITASGIASTKLLEEIRICLF